MLTVVGGKGDAAEPRGVLPEPGLVETELRENAARVVIQKQVR